MNQIGIAVVGTGFIGPVHVEALRRLGLNVIGILGSSKQKSVQAQIALRLSRAYCSLEELLADNNLHSVHLAVPNDQHCQMIQQVLAAGKHLMCEKPLALNCNEGKHLVQVARASNLFAAVCYNQRFYPLNLQAHEMIKSGKLGNIFAIQGHYLQDWLMYDTDYNWRVLPERGGALRAVADIGTHWMDLLTFITGLKITEVFADLTTVHAERYRPPGEIETFDKKAGPNAEAEAIAIDTEDYATILFRFENGAKGSLSVSQITAGCKNRLQYQISGSRQSLAWDSESPNNLSIGQRNQPNTTLIRDPALLEEPAAAYSDYPGGHNEGFADTFKQCFRSFYNALDGKDTASSVPLYATFEDGYCQLQLCQAILESNRSEKWVTL